MKPMIPCSALPLSFPSELHPIIPLFFKDTHGNMPHIEQEEEGKDYAAHTLTFATSVVKFRVGKKTPAKAGQFATIWKRMGMTILPFQEQEIDYLIIVTRSGAQLGAFIFPVSVLREKGIVSTLLKKGKLATRVYPPWDITMNKQAQKTQTWQLDYFIDLRDDAALVSSRAAELIQKGKGQ